MKMKATGWKDAEPVPECYRLIPLRIRGAFSFKGWTVASDRLPTEERVAAMIAGSNRRPDEIVTNVR